MNTSKHLKPDDAHDVAVLIVGAGPTGLALAAQLRSFGVRTRIVDRALDRARESRALAVQARTLELLQSVALADALVARGNTSAGLMLHFRGRVAGEASLGGFGATDTRFPFILFVSQAETEALLGEHLASHGVRIERGVELTDFSAHAHGVACVLRHGDGREEQVSARYLVGCDGAHSTVRKRAGIPFEGEAYLQDFMLGDVEADADDETGLRPNTLHSFVGRRGVTMFFPLGHPRTWRVIAISSRNAQQHRSTAGTTDESIAGDLSLGELQAAVDGATGGGVHVRDPAWLTHFRLHHRQAARYREGRVFVAGDAGHIHSPVGAQGMNTGIQDAWNLGWKLAFVTSGAADPRLLDSYGAERWPVGRTLLRYTDRALGLFIRAMSESALADWFRRTVLARVLPAVLRSTSVRAGVFRFVSELAIHYRQSPIVTEGSPRLAGGPRAGDRLPDARVTRGSQPVYLQQELAGARLQLILCGPLGAWNEASASVSALAERHAGVLVVRHLTRDRTPGGNAILVDPTGEAFARLGIAANDTAQCLVRPDGYVAFRCGGTDVRAVSQYMERWFPGPA